LSIVSCLNAVFTAMHMYWRCHSGDTMSSMCWTRSFRSFMVTTSLTVLLI